MIFNMPTKSFSDGEVQDILSSIHKEYTLKSSEISDNFKNKERRLIQVEHRLDSTVIYEGIIEVTKEDNKVIKTKTFVKV